MEIAGVIAFSTVLALRGLLPSNSLGHGQRINLVTWLEDNPLIGMRKRWKIKTRNKSKLDPPSHCNPPILLGVQNSALIFWGGGWLMLSWRGWKGAHYYRNSTRGMGWIALYNLLQISKCTTTCTLLRFVAALFFHQPAQEGVTAGQELQSKWFLRDS